MLHSIVCLCTGSSGGDLAAYLSWVTNTHARLAEDLQAAVAAVEHVVYYPADGRASCAWHGWEGSRGRENVKETGETVDVTFSASGTPIGPASTASRASVECKFPVHDTPTRNDPLHRTVELPKPVTPDVATDFNNLFGRG